MSGAELAQVLTAVGVVVTALGTAYNGRKIKNVEKHTNGMHTELVALTAKTSKQEGIEEEKERAK